MTAMIRNLATMTKVGLLSTMSAATQTVVAWLGDNARLAKAGVHPIAVLAARILLAVDVSGSMTCGSVAGVPGLSPRIASTAMALVTAATERDHAIVAFADELTPLTISPHQRLDDIVRETNALPFGGTDCSLPMLWAERRVVGICAGKEETCREHPDRNPAAVAGI